MTEHARRKSSPIPDEPRPKKKAVKKRIRSDHKHEYELVAVDADCYYKNGTGRHTYYPIVDRCRICGKVGDVRFWTDTEQVPDGMRLFKVDGWVSLFDRYLPDDKEVK